MAKRQLEELRDTLFSYTGIRWVLCGALGIVYGIMSSPRLEGRLLDPIEIQGVDIDISSEILTSRIKSYSKRDVEEAYLPLREEEFCHLYELLNKNIRNALSYSNKYCLWVIDQDYLPKSDTEKEELYFKWLEFISTKKAQIKKGQITPRTFKVFEKGIEKGGEFSPSEYEDFEFKSVQAMRPHINNLEDFGLVTSSRDESDKRRKTIIITPEGWLFNYGYLKIQDRK